MSAPWLSVILPAHQAERILPDTVGAIRAALAPEGGFEVIVVDDASTDGTSSAAAALADRVVRLPAPAGGPGRARNAGAEVARGEWLLFVDADVRIHRDALVELRDSVADHPAAVAIFGTYDETPEADGVVSKYRNLLHRWVHLRGAGIAGTFWAGLGAIRRDTFRAAGGFDARRFPRPQIEDVELGYRIREQGGVIVLDPSLEGTHLKRWTLGAMFRNDFLHRAIPWMRLLLERRGRLDPSLSVSRIERLRVAGVAAGILGVAASFGFRAAAPGLIGAVCLVAVTASNLALYRWLRRRGGLGVALAAVPLHLGYYVLNVVAVGVAVASLAGRRLRSGFRTPRTPVVPVRGSGGGAS